MERKDMRINGKKTGEKISMYMKEIGLTVPEFARMLDVTENAVRNYINGHNLPTTERLYAICKILHKDIKDIVVEIKEDEKKQGASDDKV